MNAGLPVIRSGGFVFNAQPAGMTGTPSQIEWAEQIKPLVNAEFDRVAAAFGKVAETQTDEARAETNAILTILEEKRLKVMANPSAGYFIQRWRELGDQVRVMLGQDARFQAIRKRRGKTQ